MEADLCNNRDLLALAAELAHLGPWKYHPDVHLFEFCDEFYALCGTDAAREGVFMSPETYMREFVHPEDTGIVAKEIEKTLLGRGNHRSVELEHRIIRRDGEVRTVIVRIEIIRDEYGKVIKCYGVHQDVTEYKRVEEALRRKTEEIRHIAYTDALTGLPNRAYINEELHREMKKARCHEASGVILFVDMDDLKTINDTFGHTYGDGIIIEAGKRITAEAGEDAFVGRIGGDEFLAILPGQKNRQNIVGIVERIIGALSDDIEVFGERFQLSASIGVAVYPDDGDTAEEIFKNADNAMYVAKNSGKNCWKFYDADMQAAAYEKMLLTKSLRSAVECGELMLHFQPQVGIADGMIVGFEALLRWHNLKHGTISPARFIPLAEQSGIIHKIGDWVLREACQFARRLADRGMGNMYVAVNVSPYQLCTDSFISNVCDALYNARIAPRQLELEITENVLITSLKENIRKLEQLQAIGVRLALDDFGTGYSSLTYLQRLPVKTLKIDKSFIDMILTDGANKAIISTIVDMAHTMNLTVVAEGVETEEQLRYLAQSNCDYVQGYFYSRPVPEEEALRLLPGWT